MEELPATESEDSFPRLEKIFENAMKLFLGEEEIDDKDKGKGGK